MNKGFDERLREVMASELDTVNMTEAADRQMLVGIHQQIKERGNIMKYPKRKMVVAIAAAIAVTGTITAVAAGKIVSMVSGGNAAVHSAVELEEEGMKALGVELYIPETLSGGSAFQEGYVTEVRGVDETGNTVSSYLEVIANYGESGRVNLSIHKPSAGIPEASGDAQQTEEYNGILLEMTEDQYLFLPPDTKPSEEDMKLEEEGKLYISYGSSEVERKAFRNVKWTLDGVKYLLFTFEDISLEDMAGMAKAYIDGAMK